MKLSIVSTLYNSEKFINEFLELCLESLKDINQKEYEIILVNDGSPDGSLSLALEKQRTIPQLKILDLSRNFGHHYAAYAGLQYADGDLIFLIDCDLEVSPKNLVSFYNLLVKENYDVVYGYQKQRQGGFFRKNTGDLFWKLINLLSDTPIPKNIVTERLMTKRYVKSLLSLGDRNLFLGGMMYWTGFEQKGVAVEKKVREGRSTYSLIKRLGLMFEAIVSFSTFPLKVLFLFGLLLLTISFILGGVLFVEKLFWPERYLSGYVSIVLIVIFFSGIIEISLGIVGLYLGRVFRQVQKRPLYIIKNIY